MTDDDHLHLQGYCYGNTIKTLAISHAQCIIECQALNECNRYVYSFSDDRPFKKKACVLKKKICGIPLLTKGRNIYSYFLVDPEGKLLHV